MTESDAVSTYLVEDILRLFGIERSSCPTIGLMVNKVEIYLAQQSRLASALSISEGLVPIDAFSKALFCPFAQKVA